jgi:hypothetical protein
VAKALSAPSDEVRRSGDLRGRRVHPVRLMTVVLRGSVASVTGLLAPVFLPRPRLMSSFAAIARPR